MPNTIGCQTRDEALVELLMRQVVRISELEAKIYSDRYDRLEKLLERAVHLLQRIADHT